MPFGKPLPRRIVGSLAIVAVLGNGTTTRAAGRQSVPSATAAAADVALQPGGVLQGQALDGQGRPLANTELVMSDGRRSWSARTDNAGNFRVVDLGGAVYRVKFAEHAQMVRCWAPGTAPPSAAPAMLFVPPSQVVRGQYQHPQLDHFAQRTKRWLANPLVFGGIVLTAIAIPVAIHNTDEDKAPATP